jgi:microcin C transport system substrate-binding protein
MELCEIRFEYYRRDRRVRELQGGNLDVAETSAKNWATAYDFRRANGFIGARRSRQAGAPMQCFVLNLRRSQFDDRRVRQAFNLAFDLSGPTRTCSTVNMRASAATSGEQAGRPAPPEGVSSRS